MIDTLKVILELLLGGGLAKLLNCQWVHSSHMPYWLCELVSGKDWVVTVAQLPEGLTLGLWHPHNRDIHP